MNSIAGFYDDLASYYHLMFESWDTSIAEQGKIIAALLPPVYSCGPILDCSCGIGTQLIGLKQLGYDVEGSDLSNGGIIRASQEAAKRDFSINVRVDDMRTLSTAPLNYYSIILTIGNSIPHLLTDQDVATAFISMKSRLKPNGTLLVGVRDYKPIISNRAKTIEPLFIQDEHGRRIIHQIWDWQDERVHTVHLYITQQINQNWVVKHFTFTYRAITLEEITAIMEEVGFTNVSVLTPEVTKFCQPIIKCHK